MARQLRGLSVRKTQSEMALRIEKIPTQDFEQVLFGEDPAVGLRSIIAVHSTRLGPSCGGIRLLPYATREEALEDVLRLAKGMSFKASVAEINFGGGKSVIILDPRQKRAEILRRFGEFVNHLDGRYIAAKDMNIVNDDLLEVKKTTRHVLGLDGVAGSSGDPSPITAIGCFEAMRAVWDVISGRPSLTGVTVAIQGLGHVGFDLARRIVKAGGSLFVSDIDRQVVERARLELGAKICSVEEAFDVECDIFSPCARGAVLNSRTIGRLRCRAVVGCANNQLEVAEDGQRLWARQILYAPDYVVNAGGIINIFTEYEGYDRVNAVRRAEGIFGTVKKILERSRQENTPPYLIADRMADERLRA